jgi:hypothetical protein
MTRIRDLGADAEGVAATVTLDVNDVIVRPARDRGEIHLLVLQHLDIPLVGRVPIEDPPNTLRRRGELASIAFLLCRSAPPPFHPYVHLSADLRFVALLPPHRLQDDRLALVSLVDPAVRVAVAARHSQR